LAFQPTRGVALSVKIFILVAVSNAMNPPLYQACTQSHVQSVWVYHDQAYPGIIPWPDYAGFPRPELKY